MSRDVEDTAAKRILKDKVIEGGCGVSLPYLSRDGHTGNTVGTAS